MAYNEKSFKATLFRFRRDWSFHQPPPSLVFEPRNSDPTAGRDEATRLVP